jgi:predicted TIM-barrel fold metal-dependent hydrolase
MEKPPSDLLLHDFKPRSQLRLKESAVEKPRFPVIDAHNHLGEEFGGGWCNRPLEELLDCLDQSGVHLLVDLDGGWGETILQQRLDKYKAGAPQRFMCFGGVDWEAWSEHGERFGEWAAARLREQVAWGAQGLKIWKNLGLRVRDQHGGLVAVNDPRLDPLWQTAGELGVPVMIHVADPPAFFDPLDASNERWEELHTHPGWHFPSPPFPAFQTILDQLADLVARHPGTTFIGAHAGCYAENLTWVGDLLDKCANFYVDISARISELGRQPYTARRFFLRYSERVLFGLDLEPNPDAYRIAYRFLESDDEYFEYSSEPLPPQGRWRIYGLNLPEETLAKVYFRNAARVLPKP